MSKHAHDDRGRPSRLREFLAAFGWAFGSWVRPADAESNWQQRIGHGVGMFENPEHEQLPSEATTNPVGKASSGQGR